MRYYCFVDGGCSRNGRIDSKAYGSCLAFQVDDDLAPAAKVDPKFWQTKTPVISDLRFDLGTNGHRSTNNTAEAQALHHLIIRLFSTSLLHPENRVIVHSDSQLVVKQVQGYWRVNSNALMDIYRQIHGIFDRFEKRYGCKVGTVLSLENIPGDLMKLIIGH